MNFSAFSLCSKAHNDLETEVVFLKWSFSLSWPNVRVFALHMFVALIFAFLSYVRTHSKGAFNIIRNRETGRLGKRDSSQRGSCRPRGPVALFTSACAAVLHYSKLLLLDRCPPGMRWLVFYSRAERAGREGDVMCKCTLCVCCSGRT